jgi:hypothetical protein
MTRLIAVLIAVLFGAVLVHVPVSMGQTTKEKPAKSETKAPAKTGGDTKKEPIDINSASAAELEGVKGIGEATAKKIIEGRPYKAKDELVTKKIMSKGAYDKIKNQLIAKQEAGASAPTAATPPPPAKSAESTKTPAAKTESSTKATTEAKPAPAKGMVWVNTDSGIFHREGDRWYGKTKQGKYMTEADALKEGYREAKH